MQEEKKKQIGTLSILAALFLMMAGSWFYQPLQVVTAQYGTLLSGVALGVAFICCSDLKKIFYDPVCYLMLFAEILTVINLFVIDSDKGALLTVADLLLVIYLADRVVISKRQMLLIGVLELFFFFYWTLTPKGYYQGFNINYGGLVLLTGLLFGMLFIQTWEQKEKYQYALLTQIVLVLIGCRVTYVAYSKMYWLYGVYIVMSLPLFIKHKKQNKCLWILQATLMVLGLEIISYYLSRCALIGAIVFMAFILIPQKFWKSAAGKVFYGVVCFGLTFGTVVFSLFLMWLAKRRDILNFQFLYKDIFSGREEVWAELWGVFMKQPFTGIGSSYTLHVSGLEGTFEVHSGLLDILFVHGSVVFVIILCLLLLQLFRLRKHMADNITAKYAVSAIFAMLATSFFENYFIVPPFLLLFLLLFAVANKSRGKGDASKT